MLDVFERVVRKGLAGVVVEVDHEAEAVEVFGLLRELGTLMLGEDGPESQVGPLHVEGPVEELLKGAISLLVVVLGLQVVELDVTGVDGGIVRVVVVDDILDFVFDGFAS